jgi:transposase
VTLVWVKRIWRCVPRECEQQTWTETHPAIALRGVVDGAGPGKGVPTSQVAMGMRGRGGRDFGVGWATVMAAVREDGARLLRRAQLGAQASAIGVDETAFTRATALTATVFAPDVVDLHAGKLIDVLEVEPEKYWRTGFLSTSTVG